MSDAKVRIFKVVVFLRNLETLNMPSILEVAKYL